MLGNAVDGLTELRNIEITDVRLQVTNGIVISYDGYFSLLYGAA